MEDIKTMSIIEKLKESRKRARLTQAELASIIGVQANTVWRWEKGKASPMESIIEIARALNTSVAYLTGETDDPTRYSSLLSSGPDGHTGNDPLQYSSEKRKKIAAQHRRLLRLKKPPLLGIAPIAAACDDVRAQAASFSHQDRVVIAGILKSTLTALESAEEMQSEKQASAGGAG